VANPDAWENTPDEEDAGEPTRPVADESAIGARVDPALQREEPEPTPDPTPSTPGPRDDRDRSEASAWRRLGAYLVDTIVLSIPTNLVIQFVMGRPFPAEIDFSAPASTLEVIWPFAAVAFAVEVAYFAGFEASKLQATIGKHLLNVEVTDHHGQQVSLLRAFVRNAAKLASALPFFLGFLMIFTSSRNQALHDHIASCLVLDAEDEEDQGPTLEEPQDGWEP
jgi:uncharacterized RDD family membrane protein YckC